MHVAEDLLRDFEGKWWEAAKKADEFALREALSYGEEVLVNTTDVEGRRSLFPSRRPTPNSSPSAALPSPALVVMACPCLATVVPNGWALIAFSQAKTTGIGSRLVLVGRDPAPYVAPGCAERTAFA
jgi:hypothetical protein